jgi:serine/threonine protein phosphatase PrpC
MGTADGAKFTVGESIDLGGRTSQQDLTMVNANLIAIEGTPYHVFGVFDGHGSFCLK